MPRTALTAGALALFGLLALGASPLARASQELSHWSVCTLTSQDCRAVGAGTDLSTFGNQYANGALFKATFTTSDPCFQNQNCWVFLGEVADSAKLSLDGTPVASYHSRTGQKSYIRNKSILLPLAATQSGPHELQVEIHDLNETISGLRSPVILIGEYEELTWRAQIDWLRRTGSTLMSAFALAVMALALGLIYLTNRSRESLALSIYSAVTAFYHLSFSEVIREFTHTEAASGPIHFSLRLLQDATLFYALTFLLKSRITARARSAIFMIYAVAIAGMNLAWIAGFHHYSFYLNSMYLCAPLVAFPLFYGLACSFAQENKTERTALLASFSLLSIFQVNDLLVFWQIYRGQFFVRWYPALVVVLLGWLYVRQITRQVARIQVESALGNLASQVAHDIRSPLAALSLAERDIHMLPEDTRTLIRSAVGRIDEIAHRLLEKNRETNFPGRRRFRSRKGDEPTSPQLLFSIIKGIVAEKRSQFRSRPDIEISIHPEAEHSPFSLVQACEFKCVISNLINNSVEALIGPGKVLLDVRSKGDEIQISVSDTGKGIDPSILPRLTQRGETYGKEGGSGLGLYHARTTCEAWNGSLKIESEPGAGTRVTLVLPRVSSPSWFLERLAIPANSTLVVLDDDSSIHQVWQGRLDGTHSIRDSLKILHLSTPNELRARCRQSGLSDYYLLDQELWGYSETGLDLAEELGISARSVLVTSRDEEHTIRQRCQKLGIKLLPKALSSSIPLSIQSLEESAPA